MPESAATRKLDWARELGRPIKRLTDANVRYATSLAEAVRKGYATFGDSVTEANVGQLDLSNGFIEGTVRGWIAALEELPHAVAGFYEALLDRPSARPTNPSRAKRERTGGKQE